MHFQIFESASHVRSSDASLRDCICQMMSDQARANLPLHQTLGCNEVNSFVSNSSGIVRIVKQSFMRSSFLFWTLSSLRTVTDLPRIWCCIIPFLKRLYQSYSHFCVTRSSLVTSSSIASLMLLVFCQACVIHLFAYQCSRKTVHFYKETCIPGQTDKNFISTQSADWVEQ